MPTLAERKDEILEALRALSPTQLDSLAQQMEQLRLQQGVEFSIPTEPPARQPPDTSAVDAVTRSLGGALSNQAPFPFDAERPERNTLLRQIGNVPFSVGQRGRELIRAVADPVGTVQGMGQLASGVAQFASNPTQALANVGDPGIQAAVGATDEIISSVADPRRRFEDPTAGVANIASIASPALQASRAPLLARLGRGAQVMADPARTTLKAGGKAAKIGARALSSEGGLAAAFLASITSMALGAGDIATLLGLPVSAFTARGIRLVGRQFGNQGRRIADLVRQLDETARLSGITSQGLNVAQLLERVERQQTGVANPDTTDPFSRSLTGGGF